MTDYNNLQILCSAGKGQMSAQDCLDCAFAQGHPPCNMDYGLLKAMYTNPDRSDMHVTDLTSCLRKAWYGKRQPQPEYPHDMLARHVGTMFHATMEISDEIGQSEVPITYDDVYGTIDRTYIDGRIVDYKSTKYIYLDKLPYSSHDLQVNIYGYMRRKSGLPGYQPGHPVRVPVWPDQVPQAPQDGGVDQRRVDLPDLRHPPQERSSGLRHGGNPHDDR